MTFFFTAIKISKFFRNIFVFMSPTVIPALNYFVEILWKKFGNISKCSNNNSRVNNNAHHLIAVMVCHSFTEKSVSFENSCALFSTPSISLVPLYAMRFAFYTLLSMLFSPSIDTHLLSECQIHCHTQRDSRA